MTRNLVFLASLALAACVTLEPPKEDTGTGTASTDCLDPFDDSAWVLAPGYAEAVHFRRNPNNYACQPIGSDAEWHETFEVDLFSFTVPELLVSKGLDLSPETMTESDAEDQVRAAMSLWNDVSSALLTFDFNAPPAAHTTASNLEADPGVGLLAGTLGEMVPEAVTETNVVADIVIFAEYTDGYGSKFTVPYSLATFPDTDEYSLQQVLVHELGHAAGFRHSEDEDSVMYAEAQLGWVGAILPSDDDGLSFIYN